MAPSPAGPRSPPHRSSRYYRAIYSSLHIAASLQFVARPRAAPACPPAAGDSKRIAAPVTGWVKPRLAACSAWRGKAAERARRPRGGHRRRRRPADARRRPCARGSGGCARSRAGTRPAPPPGPPPPEPLQHPRPGHRRLAVVAQHRHPLAVARMPADPPLDPEHRRPAPRRCPRGARAAARPGPARRGSPRGSAARGRAPRTARASPRCAASDFATTRSPEVSLSMRWTMPGRSRPPIPDSVPPQWCRSAFTSVPSGAPGAGCTTSPAGLSMTMRSASSYTMSSGIASAAARIGRGARQAHHHLGPRREPQPRVVEHRARRPRRPRPRRSAPAAASG